MMKNSVLVIILLTLTIQLAAQKSDKPKFFYTFRVSRSANYNAATSYFSPEAFTSKFGNLMFSALKEAFPCADAMNSIDGIQAAIADERMFQLLGGRDADNFSGDKAVKDIGKNMECDYLLVLKATISNTSLMLVATCLDNKKATMISNTVEAETARSKQGDMDLYEKALPRMVKHIIDDLKKYQVCPYKGDVNIKVLSERDNKEVEEHDVYCGKMDRKYKKTTTIQKRSSAEWTLQKKKKIRAVGNVKYSLAEKLEVEEIDDCYQCEPLVTGRRTSSEIKISFAEIEGLGTKKINDEVVSASMVEIKFLEDGRYVLVVEAASEKGDLNVSRGKKVNCECCKDDDANEPQKTTISKTNVGIKEVFGPFKGTPDDKVLSEKQTIKRVNPQTKEKETVSFDFNLSRE